MHVTLDIMDAGTGIQRSNNFKGRASVNVIMYMCTVYTLLKSKCIARCKFCKKLQQVVSQ